MTLRSGRSQLWVPTRPYCAIAVVVAVKVATEQQAWSAELFAGAGDDRNLRLSNLDPVDTGELAAKAVTVAR